MSQNVVIQLSVGGVRYDTTLATLTRDEDSMLATMFSGRWDLPVTNDGCKLIDRDGNLFGYILNYLRGSMTPKMLLPTDRHTMDRLYEEALYFNLAGLTNMIDKHDMNSRKFCLSSSSTFYSRDNFQTPFIRPLPIRSLRIEKSSYLTMKVEKVYKQTAEEAIGDIFVSVNFAPEKWNDHNKSFFRSISPNCETDYYFQNNLKKLDDAIENFFHNCAWQSIYEYLGTGQLSIDFNEEKFNQLVTSITRYNQIATYINIAQINRDDTINKLLRPLIIEIATYFGFSMLLAQLQVNS